MPKYKACLYHIPSGNRFDLSKTACEPNLLGELVDVIQKGEGVPNISLDDGRWVVIPNKIMQECVLLYEDVEE